MPTSIRLNPATERALEELAKRRGETKSRLLRSAIEGLLAREQITPYELVEDLVGSVSGGPRDLSERTGQKFRAVQGERRK